jgi:transposase
MIPHGVEIFVGLERIDLRWGFERLAGIVAERIGRDARSGALFVFFGRRREAMKIVFFDGTGMCLFYNQQSSHYTSFDLRRGPSFPLGDVRPPARSLSRFQRLQCFVGWIAGSS